MKQCRTCKCKLEKSYFTKNKRSKDGLNTECKTCSRARSKKAYHKEPEKHRTRAMVYAERHKVERAIYCAKRRAKIQEEANYIDRDSKACYKCKEEKTYLCLVRDQIL